MHEMKIKEDKSEDKAKCLETGESVAIKKVLQDKRYKNREYLNVENNEVYLNVVLEYVHEIVYRVSRHYIKMTHRIPLIYIQLYTYQALNYIHCVIGVCHGDIKPQNLLVDPHTHRLKLCDFGSEKMLGM